MAKRFNVISIGGWNKVQLSMAMPEALSQHIEHLVTESGNVDELELIKNALYLYERAVRIKNNGGQLQYVKTVDGEQQVTPIEF